MSQLLWRNPVLLRELQQRVTSRRTMLMVTIWLVLVCGIAALYYTSEVSDTFSANRGFGTDVLRIARVGQNLFDWVLTFMIGLVLFLVPGITAASIAGERERQTLLPMQVTLLRPIDIIVGKVAASVVFVLVLIILTAPVLAFAYLIGGITIAEVFLSLALMVFSALAIACLTVACSALVRRVTTAVLFAYGVMLVLVFGSLALLGIVAATDDSRGFDQVNPPLSIVAVNPVVAIADVSGDASREFFGAETPLAVLREMLAELRFERWDDRFGGGFDQGFAFEEAIAVNQLGQPVPFPPPPGFVQDGPVLREFGTDNEFNPNVRTVDRWLPFLAQYLIVMTALSLFAIWIAARRVRTPAKVER